MVRKIDYGGITTPGNVNIAIDNCRRNRSNDQFAIKNGPVEIVSFLRLNMVIFHSYVKVYQRIDDTIVTCKQFE